MDESNLKLQPSRFSISFQSLASNSLNGNLSFFEPILEIHGWYLMIMLLFLISVSSTLFHLQGDEFHVDSTGAFYFVPDDMKIRFSSVIGSLAGHSVSDNKAIFEFEKDNLPNISGTLVGVS